MGEWLCKTLLLNVLLVGIVKGVDSTPCTFDVTGSSGTIISNSSGNYKNCRWIITAPRDHNIRLEFIRFQLLDLPSKGLQSWIRVYNGKNTNDTLLGVYTGARRPFTIQSSGRFLLVILLKQNEVSPHYFKGNFTSATTIDKPEITYGMQSSARTVPGHILWCSAEGTPPVNMSLLKSSTPFANGTGSGMVTAKIYEEGNYTCVATNKADKDSTNIEVFLLDCKIQCLSSGRITNYQVENVYNCTDTQLPTDWWTCIPETTTKLDLSKNQLQNLSTDIFSTSGTLQYLDLSQNQLQDLVLKGDNLGTLQYLDLSQNQLQDLYLAGDDLGTLQYLDLSQNQLGRQFKFLFSDLGTLQYLDLAQNQLVILNERIFSDLGTLQYLNLSSNKLIIFRERTFASVSSLSHLYISNNRIRGLYEQNFQKLSALKELDLGMNLIYELPRGIFSNLSKLRTLNLYANRIYNLPHGIFSNLSKLEQLSLCENGIYSLSHGDFSNLWKLEKLSLCDNAIRNLPPGIFSKLSKLEKLDLRDNYIRDLPPGIFSNLSKLETLFLHRNKIQRLPAQVFSNLSALKVLDLHGNDIRDLPPGIFSNLSKLETLYLYDNGIRDLPPGVFSNLSKLETLRLDDNGIHNLPPGIFSNLSKLETLSLYSNKIQQLPAEVFSNLSTLETLQLYNNKIQRLPALVFSKLSTLKTLEIQKNDIRHLPQDIFSHLSALLVMELSFNKIENITVGLFSNLHSLEFIFLHNNDIRSIPNGAFVGLKSLKFLLLADNPIKTIGSRAFTMPEGDMLIVYMIRTNVTSVSHKYFNDASNLTSTISIKDGEIGTMKFTDLDERERCTIHLGLGYGNSEYIDINRTRLDVSYLRWTFGLAGFARTKPGDETKLLPCPTGTFVKPPITGWYKTNLSCTKCPAGGFYSDTQAFVSNGCRQCPNGTFVPYNNAPGKKASDCIACPQGTGTDSFAGLRACKCLDNFYRTALFEGCKPCNNDGLKCANDVATLKPGYWWRWKNESHKEIYKTLTNKMLSNVTIDFTDHMNSLFPDFSSTEYPHALPKPHRCGREKSCTGGIDSLCEDGYEGPLCEICSEGYYKQLKICKACPTKISMLIQLLIPAALISIITALLVWRSKRKSTKTKERTTVDIILSRLKIVIGFYQVTFGLLEAFSYIKWPDSLAVIGKYSEMLQVNFLQIAPVHCLFPELKVDAFGSLFAILAINIGVIIISFAVYGIVKLVLEHKASKTKELIYRSTFFFLYVTYLSTCSKTANVLPVTCHRLCADETEKQEECPKFLKADYSIDCEGSKYSQSVIVAYVAVGYILFLPTASLLVLWRHRKTLRQTKNEDEQDTSDTPQQSTELLTGLRFLYENYRPQAWYWELVETVRKVVLTSGLILVGGESRAYVGLACVLASIYGVFFAHKHPIADPFENRLMLISLVVTIVNLVIGAVSKIPKENISTIVDPYMDNIIFKVLVIGANTSVIGLLVVQYGAYVYRYIKEWRKNPKWSLSCCLALLVPLNNLQGDIGGMAGKNILKQQLQTGNIEVPSISDTLKESRVVNVTLEEEETNHTEEPQNSSSETAEQKGQKIGKRNRSTTPQSNVTLVSINVKPKPNEIYETAL